MEPEFDFDIHFRRMELASDEEFPLLQKQLRSYLNTGSVDEQVKRTAAWKQALVRLRERSKTELTLMRELIGTPEPA